MSEAKSGGDAERKLDRKDDAPLSGGDKQTARKADSNTAPFAETRGEALSRTALLLGESAMERLAGARVAVVGVGGVGGHCAEALARAGVGALHLVDGDVFAGSNLNRQLFATYATLGMEKPTAARERIAAFSRCRVSTVFAFITEENIAEHLCGDFDYIVDAIDQLSGKLALVRFASERNIPILSCMGAGNRLDAAAFCVKDIFATSGCPLARRMRQSLRKMGISALDCVVSNEPPAPHESSTIGSLAPVTGAAGLIAAGKVCASLSEKR